MAAVGSRVGFIWIYGLIVLFATGIIEIIIMPAIQHNLVPSLIQAANTTMVGDDMVAFTAQIDQVVRFMHFMPYVVMFIILVYMILSIFKKEEQEVGGYYQP